MGSGQPEGQQLGSQEGERGALLECGSQEGGVFGDHRGHGSCTSPRGLVGAGLELEARSLGTCTSGEMSISVTASPASSELADLSQGGWSDVVPRVLGCKVGGTGHVESAQQEGHLEELCAESRAWSPGPTPALLVSLLGGREGMGAGGRGAGDDA